MIDLSQPTVMPSVTIAREETTTIMEGRVMAVSAPTEIGATARKTSTRAEGMKGHPTADRRSDSLEMMIIKTSITMKRI